METGGIVPNAHELRLENIRREIREIYYYREREFLSATVDCQLRQNVSKRLGPEWKETGRYLDLISDQQMDELEACGSNKESAYQMLRKWTELAGSNATPECLADALRKAGRTDVAEYVERQGHQKLQKILGLKSTFELSEHLNRGDALSLAKYHNLANKDIQEIEKSDNPGATCIEKLMSRKIITSLDFSGLNEAVEMLKEQKIKEYLNDFVGAGINRNSTKDEASSVTISYLRVAQKLNKDKSLKLSLQFEFERSDLDRIRQSMNPGVTFITLAVFEKRLFKVGDLSSLEASITKTLV